MSSNSVYCTICGCRYPVHPYTEDHNGRYWVCSDRCWLEMKLGKPYWWVRDGQLDARDVSEVCE